MGFKVGNKEHALGKTPACHPDRKYHAKDLCKECYEAKRSAAYYQENKEALDTQQKAWKKKNESKVKDYHRQHKLWEVFRLTPEEWDTILEYQGGVCAISGKPPVTVRLSTDHNHRSGLVRGLLSLSMNRGLGYFNDDPVLLRKAADYLENPPAIAALGREVFGVIGKAKHKKTMVYGSPNGPIKAPKKAGKKA